MFRIEICGSIATGKTTLATKLSQMHGFILAREVYRGVPFWAQACEFPGEYEFERNISFLLSQADIIHTAAAQGQSVVCDFALFQNLAYASFAAQEDFAVIEQIYRRLRDKIPPVSALIHLSCSPETQISRIHKRGRGPELKITVDYLEALTEITVTLVNQLKADERLSIMEINTDEVDFTSGATRINAIAAQIVKGIA